MNSAPNTSTTLSTITRNSGAVIAASGSALGYALLNLATKNKLGLGMAITSAIFSASLNAIFHALAVQQIPIKGVMSDIPILTGCAIAATLGTGYIYAVAKQAALEVISKNNQLAISIALLYQLSWVLPISLVLYLVIDKIRSTISSTCEKQNHAATEGRTESLALIINDNDEKLLTKTESTQIRDLSLTFKIIITCIAITCTAAMITNSAQAAYQLLKETPADNVIDKFYKTIYGNSIESSVAAHLPQAAWAITSGMDGLTAMAICTQDFCQKLSIRKASTALSAIAVLGFTCVTTYLVATYGQNSENGLDLAILIFALAGASFGNFVSGVKYAQGMIGLTEGPKAAMQYVSDARPATSFLATKEEVSTNVPKGDLNPYVEI